LETNEKEVVVAYYKSLFRQSSGGTEVNNEILSQDNQSFGPHTNWGPLK